MTRVTELRELGEEELVERLESLKEELFNLRFQLATGQLDNPMRIKQVRHEIARILTLRRERDLEVELGFDMEQEAPAVEEPAPARSRRLRRARAEARAEAEEAEVSGPADGMDVEATERAEPGDEAAEEES